MKDITIEHLARTIAVLDEVRVKRVCCYASKGICDCKYGGGQIGDLYPRDGSEPQVNMAGEGCGCPELRFAIGVLGRLTLEEIQDLLERKPLR